MTPGETPKLAEDGLCVNTECAIRGSEQCPVYRMMRDVAIPEVNNIINLPNNRGDMAGFQKTTFDGYRPENVIGLREGERWLELMAEAVKEDKNNMQKLLLRIISQTPADTPTAEIIAFPSENSV